MSGGLHYRGKLYRALNPIYAKEPLSGAGAARFGGRFNAKGVPALYMSLSPLTALREANQVGALQPTTLVCFEADIESIFDTRDLAALACEGMTPETLAASTWRDEMKTGEARGQTFAGRLNKAGYCGLLVRSFAPGSTGDDLNLVLWTWGADAPARLILIDDEGRLSPARS
ncbi:RES domain-containing protein [Rhodoblastus acidophilus]|nr:RES domain-containing protein [Rhodoblastus acidophilus]